MNPSELILIGANARANGQSIADNPFFKIDNMPINTKESAESWNDKAQAWNDGWFIEDVLREGK